MSDHRIAGDTGASESVDLAATDGGSAHLPAFRDPDLALFDQYQPDPDWPRPDRFAGWDIAEWCRLGVYEDAAGLHLTVSTRDKDYIRAVTPEQVTTFANNLSALLRAIRKYPSDCRQGCVEPPCDWDDPRRPCPRRDPEGFTQATEALDGR